MRLDTQRMARGWPREQGRSNGRTYKVRPFFLFLFYSTNRNLTTLSIPTSSPCFQNTKTRKTRPNRHTRYTHYLFFFNFNCNNLFSLPHPQSLKTSASACFQGWGYDLSLATTTTHNPQKRAVALIFGGMTSPWHQLPPTTPENEHNSLFSRGMTFLWPPPPPPPPKNEPRCLFSGGGNLSLATTTTHNPQKRAIALLFRGVLLSPSSLPPLSLPLLWQRWLEGPAWFGFRLPVPRTETRTSPENSQTFEWPDWTGRWLDHRSFAVLKLVQTGSNSIWSRLVSNRSELGYFTRVSPSKSLDDAFDTAIRNNMARGWGSTSSTVSKGGGLKTIWSQAGSLSRKPLGFPQNHSLRSSRAPNSCLSAMKSVAIQKSSSCVGPPSILYVPRRPQTWTIGFPRRWERLRWEREREKRTLKSTWFFVPLSYTICV